MAKWSFVLSNRSPILPLANKKGSLALGITQEPPRLPECIYSKGSGEATASQCPDALLMMLRCRKTSLKPRPNPA